MAVPTSQGVPPLRDERDDIEQVVSWRLEQLRAVGYELPDAEKLAQRLDLDLHDACELVTVKHCDVATAVRILL